MKTTIVKLKGQILNLTPPTVVKETAITTNNDEELNNEPSAISTSGAENVVILESTATESIPVNSAESSESTILAQFIKAHTKALAAQTQTAAAQ